MPHEVVLPAPPATMDLAELLATRLCHDLAGLCGTLQGALELLGEEPAEAPEALTLSREAAQALSDRLRVIRAAWGATAQPLDRAAILQLAAGLPGAPRVALDATGFLATVALPPDRSRIVLNSLLFAAESLLGGGTIHLVGDDTGFGLALEGRRARWPAYVAGLLDGPGDTIGVLLAEGPRGIQAALLVRLVRAAGAHARLLPGNGPSTGPELRIDWRSA